MFKEFAICSIDELRDEKNQNGRHSVVLPFWKKTSSLEFSVSEKSPALARSAYSTLDSLFTIQSAVEEWVLR